MAEALGEALLYLRTDDRGLDAGISKAKGKSDQLGVSFDNASEKADHLGNSMDRAGQSASRFGDVQTKVTTQTGAQRAGLNQLMMQVNDMGTMYSLGARPMQIFSSQIGQVTQAMQLMSGGTSRLAMIMGSPWTMAISTAAVVLIPLIANLFDTEDAADKASKANEAFADKLDRTKNSYSEVVAAVREYNAEQKKATETTLQNAAAAAAAAAANVREALSIRQKLAAQLAEARARFDQQSAGSKGGLEIKSAYGAQVGRIEGQISANNAELARLSKDASEATANVAEELAKLDTDPTERARLGFAELRKEARRTIKDVEQLRQRLGDINRAEKTAIDAANKEKRGTNNSRTSDASAASVGDMSALIKSLFPGARITSTTGGKHTKGSDHYSGRALDFVPGGGMGQYSTAEVQKILEDAGVTIRRNARGTQQLFGPGRSASKQGDHDDHFHVAWSGGASPEEAERRRAQAAERKAREEEREARRVERYSRDLAGLQDAALDLQAQLGQTAEERYQLEKQGLEISIAEQQRRIEVNADYTAAEKATLLVALEKKAALERELLSRRRAEELARQQLEIAQAMRSDQIDVLQAELRLAETREERREIEQRILDLTYQQERAALEAILASNEATEAQKAIAQARLRVLDQLKSGDRKALDREYESPLERYKRELEGVGKNLNDEMEKVAVNGLDRLSDGLTDVIMNAKSLGDVFAQVAKQMLADMIRLFIQQQLILPLLNAMGVGNGGGGGGGGGGGIFGTLFGGGGGGGILGSLFGGGGKAGNAGSAVKTAGKFAGMFADGGLIPNGSFGIVGEAGPEPVFAKGGGIGVMPNSALRAMGASGGDLHFDLRGAVMTEQLLSQINAMSQANVRSGIADYDRGVGARVQDNMARRG